MSRRKIKSVSVDGLESRVLFAAVAKQVMGFLPDYEINNSANTIFSETSAPPTNNLNWSQLSQIDYYSVLPTGSDTVSPTTDSGDQFSTQLPTLVSDANAHHVGVWLVVGGGDANAISAMNSLLATGATSAQLSTFATAVAGVVNTYGLSGVDLDWEPLSAGSAQVTNFGQLIADLHGNGLNVSADTLPIPTDIGNSDTADPNDSILPFNSTAFANLSSINVEEYTDGSFTAPDTNTFAGQWATAVGAANVGKLQFGVGLYSSDANGTLDNAEAEVVNQNWGGMFVWTLADPATNPDLARVVSDLNASGDSVAAGNTADISGAVSNSSGPIAGVTVYIDSNNSSTLDSGETSDVTDSNGKYSFPGLAAGSDVVRQIPPTGDTQTTPASGTALNVTLSEGQAATGENFVDAANVTPPPNTASISGTVFADLNENEVQDAGEPGIAGATVYIDSNNNGTLDAGEPTAVTNSSGVFTLSNLAAGTYTVREVPPAGDGILGPSGGQYSVGLTSGQVSTGWNFADSVPTPPPPQTATVEGTVSNQSNSGISGVTVFLDANNNGTLDSGELSTTTNLSGDFIFTTAPAGTSTSLIVRQVVPSGDVQTSPAGGLGQHLPATLTPGASYIENFVDGPATIGPAPLSGTVIGTTGSYHSDGDTGANAVDGNLSTFFDAPTAGTAASPNWVGLDLGNTFSITSIKFAARSGYEFRMEHGIFQASNDPTFASGVVNLYSIGATAPASGNLTSVNVTATGSYRYVRYLAPVGGYGNIAEMEFFGTAAVTGGLTGTIIGTTGSYQNDGDTGAKAVDGNLATFFDAPTAGTAANPNWVGLDLGNTFSITSIKFAARSGYEFRMVGGIFQASNDPTFATGVVNLFTVKTSPSSGSLTAVNVTTSGSYGYVRYLAPVGGYGNIAEMQFFGSASSSGGLLSGAVIGTTGSYQNDGNTGAKAVDGNLSTFFDAPSAGTVSNPDWVGLDLGSTNSITQIAFAPRSGYESRMVGGIFQASNDPTFTTGVVNLYTVTAAPKAGNLTTISISAAGSYRYVRYLAPAGAYGNIAEMQFFGAPSTSTAQATIGIDDLV